MSSQMVATTAVTKATITAAPGPIDPARPTPTTTTAYYTTPPSPPPNCSLLPPLCTRRRVALAPLHPPAASTTTSFALADCSPSHPLKQTTTTTTTATSPGAPAAGSTKSPSVTVRTSSYFAPVPTAPRRPLIDQQPRASVGSATARFARSLRSNNRARPQEDNTHLPSLQDKPDKTDESQAPPAGRTTFGLSDSSSNPCNCCDPPSSPSPSFGNSPQPPTAPEPPEYSTSAEDSREPQRFDRGRRNSRGAALVNSLRRARSSSARSLRKNSSTKNGNSGPQTTRAQLSSLFVPPVPPPSFLASLTVPSTPSAEQPLAATALPRRTSRSSAHGPTRSPSSPATRTPRRRATIAAAAAASTSDPRTYSHPSSPSITHQYPPSSYRATAQSIIEHHRPPPKPPVIQPQINLVAALLGEPVDGYLANGHGSHSENGSRNGTRRGKNTRRTASSTPSQRHPIHSAVNGHAFKTASETNLNAPVNIRDIVSKCEDATMSWSLQFWVTIADPLTHHVFFACPASGQCSWEPPVGAFVVPRSSDGEWWELADSSRDNQSYYYNTLTGVTQWERPGEDAFVIPLGLIQRNALPAPAATEGGGGTTTGTEGTKGTGAGSSAAREPTATTAARGGNHETPTTTTATTTTTSAVASSAGDTTHPTSNSSSVRFASDSKPSPASSITSTSPNHSNPPHALHHSTSHPHIRLVHSASPKSGLLPPTQDMSSSGAPPPTIEVLESHSPSPEQGRQQSWWERRRARAKQSHGSPDKAAGKAAVRPVEISPVLSTNDAATMFSTPPASPIPVDENPSPSKEHLSPSSVNLIFQPASPTSANYEHHNFSTEDFADRYFATKRSGVLRQRLSLEQIMEWQRSPITAPLLVLSKQSVQDSLTTFKVIQHVMGERDRAVDGARHAPAPQNTSVLNLRTVRDDRDEKTMILEEIRWMIQLGVGRVEMRDELYCQLIKQLTRNPDKDATVLGFQLFCVFVAAFGPSKSFEPFVRAFLVANIERTDFGIGIMSKFCLTRLDTWGQKGGRGRVLTLAEIEHASDAAFYPSVYGQTLETIMQRQEGAYPELRIPIILPFLADGILALGGTESEGIFRVPGDNDIIATLKTRIDRGQYQLDGVEDPHVVASLFKLWLRELEEPLVPSRLYNTALQASKSVDQTILFIKKLPDHNRRVLLFVISFMQLFLDPTVVAVTKMTPQNLALILAPNILRTSSDSLVTVFANSSFESQFVLNLLLHLDPPTVDPEYVPMHGGALSSERPSFDSAMSSFTEHEQSVEQSVEQGAEQNENAST